MRYADSLRYLNSFLNLEKISFRRASRNWNLDRIAALLDAFDHPERNFFSVIIAGTKGKGSTGFFLESILKESGIAVGFYSSPHLEDPRERIRIHGKNIAVRHWCRLLEKIRRVLNQKKIPKGFESFTYFEIMTLLAILAFQEAGAQVGIFEVGMGGRLDATNVLNAKIAILTPIRLDHEAILGNTIAKIASEKAAVIRRRADVVAAPQLKEAAAVLRRQIKKQGAVLWKVRPVSFALGLRGDFQRINAGAALRAAMLLREKYDFIIPDASIRRGLLCRHWPGRLESFKGRPEFLLDGAHNPASIEALARNVRRLYPQKRRLLIFGTSRDKKSEAMLKISSRVFPKVILTRASNPRAQDLSVLLPQARGKFENVFAAREIQEAIRFGKKITGPNGLVVIAGSFYLVGEARGILKKKKGGTGGWVKGR